MQSIYRFSINGYKVNPLFDAGLTKEYQAETGEIFFRSLISGKMKLQNSDFEWLRDQSFQTEFVVLVEMYLVDVWVEYWTGSFFKTDCSFDDDNKIVELKFQMKDEYSKTIAGMEKEFNLIKLAPARTLLDIIKRPLIQLYIPGDSVVSCFMAGSYWEQDVLNSITDVNELVNKYYFKLSRNIQVINIPIIEGFEAFAGDYILKSERLWMSKDGAYKIGRTIHDSHTSSYAIHLAGATDFNNAIYRTPILNNNSILNVEVNFNLPNGTATNLTGFVFSTPIYMRYLLDVETFMEKPTRILPKDDFVSNNRNYKRAIDYSFDLVSVSLLTQDEPTEWGLADDGKYFTPPATGGVKFYPIARSTWGLSSKWLNFSGINPAFEEKAFKTYTLKDSSLISDVIKVLLLQVDPDLTHEGTAEYSEFLYGEVNPISGNSFRVMLTQKSNILAGEYDRPAQKALITLNQIFKMLKNTFQVYWYIDNGKLKFEHISFFKNGRSYTQAPQLNVDLTRLLEPKTKKPWGYNTSRYTYAKETLPERIVFEWMDQVTTGFKGQPIVVNSKFVQAGKIDTITIEGFSSDIDYMLINPAAFSPDGFALFAAVWDEETERYELPFIQKNIDGANLKLQNGYLSIIYLQPVFWVHDLPSFDVQINGGPGAVSGITRTKTQTVKYPSNEDPDPLKLVKTYMGNGQIKKLSVNLSSRQNQIDLVYDTE